jgi:PKD repeat protein
MKKILLLVMGVMMLAGSVSAQRKMAPSSSSAPSHRTCGTQQLPDDFEKWMDDQIKADRAAGNTGKAHVVYTLPVVIHVIHNGSAVGASYNLSDAQILSQIAVLNEDYRKLNADAALVPTVWQGVAVDCEINFCLAQKDPSGAATTGIDRINRNTKGWTAPPYSQTYVDATIKPNSIWNVNKYLNIWVCPLSGGLLGYATFPPSSTLSGLSSPYGTTTTDGVVIQYNAFGRVGVLDPTYNKGRSATHEIGHWLGLRHIWGDANCGNDYCTDTPTQQTSNFGCPSFPHVTCSNGPNGDMWMNYMDYTDDPCMYMFSNDQKTRMTTVLTHTPFRVALAASDACNPPVVAEPVAAFVANNTAISVGGTVNFTDQSTNTPTSWTWTFAGGTPATSTTQNPTGITYAAAGTYDVTLVATNASGSNSLTKTGYIVVTSTAGGGCDTITNFDVAVHTPTILGSAGWGYISGQNDYLDEAKADVYTVTGSNKVVDGAFFAFGVGSSSGTGQTATATVWNDASGLPSSVLGTAALSYDTIAAAATAGSLVWVDFTPNVPVSAGSIYVGLEFGYNPGDTLAIIQCADGEITTGTAYEKWSDGTWHAFSETPASWGLNVAHLIVPVICTATSVDENSELAKLAIYPNPTRGELTVLIAEQRSKGNVSFRVLNTIGAEVFSSSVPANASGNYKLNLSKLSQGFYFVEIKTSEGRRIEKFQIAR